MATDAEKGKGIPRPAGWERAAAEVKAHIAGLLARGKGRNELFGALLGPAAPQFPPLTQADVFDLFREATGAGEAGAAPPRAPSAGGNLPPAGSGNERIGESQEIRPRLTEPERARPCAVPSGTARGAGQEGKGTREPKDPGQEEALLLPFEEYLAWAIGREGGEEPAEAWHSPLFSLVRRVKAHGDLTWASAKEAAGVVEGVLKGWLRRDREKGDPWEVYMGLRREDAWAEFYGAWDKVRYLPGTDPLALAWERAGEVPLVLSPEVADRRPPGYEQFVSLAGWLQVTMGNRPIMLPVKRVSGRMGLAEATVSRYRRWAAEDGYLVEVRESRRPAGGGRGEATRFRFAVGKFEVLRDLAQQGSEADFEQARRQAAHKRAETQT